MVEIIGLEPMTSRM